MSHTEADKIIEVARTWLGTPFEMGARVKGVGVDCTQLIGAVALEIKVLEVVNTGIYNEQWGENLSSELIIDKLVEHGFTELAVEAREPGDVLVFKIGKRRSHAAIMVSETRIIHANSAGLKQVVEVELQGRLLDKLDKVFRFPS